MRILITNDDGINAPGLEVLTEIAVEIAGPEGEVWTVAPAFEQSGVGHCISYTHPMMIMKLAPRRYAAEGSPADCVLAGLFHVMKDARPDLVLSGVNRGNNAAENVLYSGTIGGAMHAALQDERNREAALITFLVTLSGVAIAGVGSAFWGVVAGAIALLVQHYSPRSAGRDAT